MFGRKRQPLTPDQKKELTKKRQREAGLAMYRANQQTMTAIRNIPRPPGR